MTATELSELYDQIRDTARRFSREKLLPFYMQREKTEKTVDRALLREMGALGLIAPELPEEFGGLGIGSEASGIIVEEMGYGDFNIGYLPIMGSLMGKIIADHAPAHVAADWVTRIVAGEAIVAVALTEPGGGSDAASLTMRADKVDGGWLLNGEKTSCSTGDQADGILIFARTGTREERAHGISAFLLDTSAKGLSRTRFDDLGSHILGRGSLYLDDVFIPDDHLIGEPGKGFTKIMQGFDYSRALLGLVSVGAARASLDETWRYIQERRAFGQPLSAFQGVTFPLAEYEGQIEAIRQLCIQTLRLRDAGLPHTAEAAMCKWMGPKFATDAIQQCLLTHGHYGWSKDLPHQQRMRDVLGIQIGDGTAQIMKMVIARQRLRENA
ncbi:acyl-CoA dehydrogenase family protein [Paracoccus sp. N5]|uniref:acyl-CoA dehydrogenase family protein n=1 Tax=Paracoccus sp. N5 TaxID=1101189 RepID=UPI00035D92DC|nr:acyl-CoA dehydrogenase family protein [Paracoccus sp. N5]